MSRKKIFLSHRGADQAAADEVAAILRDLGHHVFDMKDWKPGAPFMAEMNRSLKEADHMIALASASYWESGMCQVEIEVAMRMHREERKGFLYAFRIEDHELEPLYSATNWGDFTKGIDRQTLVNLFGPGEPQVMTASNLQPVPTRHFFGREDAVERLHQTILRSNAASVQAVAGMGGVGKTTLALHYAHLESVAARFPIRWQVNAETLPDGAKHASTDSLDSGLAGLGHALGLAADREPDASAAQKTLAWLRAEHRDALILFDNADDAALLADYLPEGTATILVTTRINNMAGLPSLSLDRWDVDTAAEFLMDLSGDANAEQAKKLAAALDGLPLACNQAGVYAKGAKISLGAYLKLFEENPGAMLDEKAKADRNARTVAKTYQLAIEKAAADCPAVRPMLAVIAALAPEPLPIAVFGHEGAPEGLRTGLEATKAAAALVEWALAERTEVEHPIQKVEVDCITAHRLVRIVAAAQDDGEALSMAVTALGGAYPQGLDRDLSTWPLCHALDPHVDPDWSVKGWMEGAANAARRAQDRAATYLEYSRADYEQARIRFAAALAIAEETHGPEATQTAVQLSNLVGSLYHLGGTENLTRAREALERALRIGEVAQGPEHPKVAIRLSNLAEVLRALGGAENLTRAREALERALRIDEAARGPDHPNVAIRLSNLANVLLALGGAENLTRAREALERALRIDGAAHGPEHPSVGIRCINLAHVAMAEREAAEALALARRARDVLRAALGAEHGHTVKAEALVARVEGGG